MSSTSAVHTLSVASVNLILFAARQKGLDTLALAQAVGIDTKLLSNPDARVPIRQIQALWPELIRATGDPNLDLHLGELINPVAVGTLAYVMMHCPTLGGAFEKLCQYQAIVCDGIRTNGYRQNDQFYLTLTLTSPDIIYQDYALNSELSVYLSAMRALTGQSVTLNEVRFAYPQPADTREHERMFAPARLLFGATETRMVLDADWLNTPVLNASPTLFALFKQHADALLDTLKAPALQATPWRSRVKQEIITLLKGEEPTLALVADRLIIGIRTLQLHLKDESSTYQQVLDEVRRELAIKHLREPYLSTTDIAYLLGYSEPSVFFRSFRKWTGSTPGSFRSLALPQPV